jgi:hypothetical protein
MNQGPQSSLRRCRAVSLLSNHGSRVKLPVYFEKFTILFTYLSSQG